MCLALFTSYAVGSGFMRVRSFNNKTYRGGPQNWDIVQDSIGRIYFGNRDCMIVFDGERFHRYGLPNSTTVRSLLYDHNSGKIYAGGSQEFGYFFSDPDTGLLRYTSLSNSFSGDKPKFTEVWDIIKDGNNIWFRTDNHMMCYDGKETKYIWSKDRLSASAIIDNKIYAATEGGNILIVNGLTMNPLPNTDLLKGKKIVSLLPGIGTMLIGTSLDGLFYYDNNKVNRYNTPVNTFLEDNQLFSAANQDDNYVFGTVTNGAVVANFSNNTFNYINKENGLQNNTVLNATFDHAGNIWLCLDNGLDYCIFNSPVYNLIGSKDDIGTGYVTYRYGDRVYIGTNQGLYSVAYPFANGPHPIPTGRELRGQIWNITPLDNDFVVAGDAGVFVHSPSGFYKIDGIIGTFTVEKFNRNKNYALAASYDGFHLLSKESGRWKSIGHIDNDRGLRGKIMIDGNDRIWLNHWLEGIYRLWIDTDKRRFENIQLYDNKHGLPKGDGITTIIHNGKLMASTNNKVYTYSSEKDKFFVSDKYTKSLKFRKDGTLVNVKDDIFSLIDHSGIQLVKEDSLGQLSSVAIPFNSIKEYAVYGYENINYLNPNELLVTNQEGVWKVDALNPSLKKWNPKPFVSAVYANNDTLIYTARSDGYISKPLKLPFDLNTLRFDFTYPDYPTSGEILYSTYLENYDKDWSPYNKTSSREYTKLREGKYNFHVRIENQITGKIEESVLEFRILPPWYRSIWALIVYSLLFLITILILIFIIIKWKKNSELQLLENKEKEMEKIRKEAEKEALQKDYEIATLKSEQLEIDIKHKSGELSSATMNLIRKNEILNDLSSHISKIEKNRDLPDNARKELKILQSMINENISHDDVWSEFNRNFDIVYENYTKRLKETYPQLTPSDIRLCCYIKMGLVSKEIAPLLNISYKSVEMARYRLRKKMELSSDINLSEFLTNF